MTGFRTRLRSRMSGFMTYSLCWASRPHLCNGSGFHYSAISFLVPDSQGNPCLHLPLQPVSWWGSTARSFKSCWDIWGGGREAEGREERAFWAPPSAKLSRGSRMEASISVPNKDFSTASIRAARKIHPCLCLAKGTHLLVEALLYLALETRF